MTLVIWDRIPSIGLPKTTGAVSLAMLLASMMASANEKPVHDPFEKPSLLKPAAPNQAAASSSASSFLASARLTATLLAGNHSMVIVDGRTIGLGEEIDGHRLIKVLERSAVFTKDKQRLILKIDKAHETD